MNADARIRPRLAALSLFTLYCCLPLPAEEGWTRFRGPNGLGVAESTGLPVEFGPGRNVVWKTAVPPGHSSPVLTPEAVFVTAHEGDRQNYKLLVICVDRRSGQTLWRREVPRTQKGRLQNVNGPASPSPVTDGTNIYAFFQEFGLISFDAQGKERWRLPMGPFNVFYGFGASPILADDKLILPIDQDLGSHMLAVDRNTGKVIWKVDRPGVLSGYSTPTLYQPGSGPKQIIAPESFQLSAYSVDDGRRLWWVRGLACELKSVASYDADSLYINGWGFPQNQPGQQVATVPFAEGLRRYDRNGDGLVAKKEIAGDEPMDRMLSPRYGFEAFDLDRDDRLNAGEWEVFRRMLASENGLLAIRLGGKGDMTDTAVRWRFQRPVPQVPSTLLYQGVLFMVNDGGILTSFDPATGNVLKQGRLQGAVDKYFASPVGADGKVWLVSQGGNVSVVAAKGEWETLAVNALDDEVFATPAIDGGRLYVRTRGLLYCFGGSSQGAAQAGEPEITSLIGKAHFALPDNDDVRSAEKALREAPDDVDRLIAAGRAHDGVRQFRRSISLYTRAIEKNPGDVRGYRYRGHRYISTRRFGDALSDLEKAAKIAPGSYDVIYHLALARYLSGQFGQAADTYARCLDARRSDSPGKMPQDWRACGGLDDESRVAMLSWKYAALRRAGRHEEAAGLLQDVRADLPVKENVAYLNALLFYKGEQGTDAAADRMRRSATTGIAGCLLSVQRWNSLVRYRIPISASSAFAPANFSDTQRT